MKQRQSFGGGMGLLILVMLLIMLFSTRNQSMFMPGKISYPEFMMNVENGSISSAVIKFNKRFPEASVEVKMPEEFLMVAMDGVLIEQVLVNLLETAVLHGKTYTKIWIVVTHTPGRVEIAVEDDGQGIKESVLPVMFEGKISSDEEESDSKRNMGIGLSVCHSIVKAHKGGMHAENRAEGGARISFWLPMNEEDTDGY